MDAALIFDIDSSRARTAATDLAKVNAAASKLAGTWSKSENAIRRANGQFASSAEVVERYGREVQELAAKYNPALNAVYKYQQAEAELNRAIALGVLTKEQAAMQLDRLSNEYAQAANRSAAAATGLTNAGNASQRMGGQMETSSHHTANLFSQLNDIGVMMAYQNPFQLALQQGTQINQVWAQMGAQGRSLRGVMGALGSAFATMLTPMNLLTIGIIAGGAALLQWATSAKDAKKGSEDFLSTLASLESAVSRIGETPSLLTSDGVAKIRKEYGALTSEVRNLINAMREVEIMEANRAFAETMEELNRSFDAGFFTTRLQAVANATGLATAEAQKFEIALNQLAVAEGPEEQLRIITSLRQSLQDSGKEGTKLYSTLTSLESEARKMANALDDSQRFMKLFSQTASAASLSHLVSQAQALAGQINAAADAMNRISGGVTGAAANGVLDVAERMWNMATDRLQQVENSGLGDRPKQRPFSVSENAIYGPEPEKGGGGRKGGKSPAEKLAEEMKRRWETLNEGFNSEFTLAMTAYTKDQETLKWALDQKLITQREYQTNLDLLYTNAWGAKWERDQLQYQMDQEALQLALDNKLIAEEDYLRKRSELNWSVVSRLGEDMSNAWAFELGQFSEHLGQMNQIAGGYDGILRAQKIFGAASALISTYTGAAEALKLPFPQNIAAAAKVLATGMGFVNAIKGAGSGGGGGGASASANPSVNTPPALQDRYVTVNFDGPQWMRDGINGLLDEIYQQSKDGRKIIVQEAGR